MAVRGSRICLAACLATLAAAFDADDPVSFQVDEDAAGREACPAVGANALSGGHQDLRDPAMSWTACLV